MNEDIKLAAKQAGVPLFRVGYAMGISESALSRKLRGQLNDKEKEAIYLAIERAADRSRDNCKAVYRKQQAVLYACEEANEGQGIIGAFGR